MPIGISGSAENSRSCRRFAVAKKRQRQSNQGGETILRQSQSRSSGEKEGGKQAMREAAGLFAMKSVLNLAALMLERFGRRPWLTVRVFPKTAPAPGADLP
ncbi:MAG: hypothetical protein R3F13_20670 [Prosthecobacter sp.]